MTEIKVRVQYFALYRDIAGIDSEIWTLPKNAMLGKLMLLIADKYGDEMRRQLFDANGVAWDTLILAVNNDAIALPQGDCELQDGDLLRLLFPVVGG